MFDNPPVQIYQASGRRLSMGVLSQSRTYSGLLVGYLGKETNQRRIARLLENGQTLCPRGGAPLLLSPKLTVTERVLRNERFVQERLPEVSCLARFDSDGLPESGADLCSSLVVVWFQDSFGIPTDPTTLQQIAEIDWEGLAAEWSW